MKSMNPFSFERQIGIKGRDAFPGLGGSGLKEVESEFAKMSARMFGMWLAAVVAMLSVATVFIGALLFLVKYLFF